MKFKNLLIILCLATAGCAQWKSPSLSNRNKERLPSSYDACAEMAGSQQDDDGVFNICPGDQATVKSSTGSVIGVNPRSKKATIRFENGNIGTFNIMDVTANKGCFLTYCVDYKGTVGQITGRIIGINPVTKKISIRDELGYINTYNIDDVSTGKGCLQGYCVGDLASVEDRAGTIIGVNSIVGKISIRFEGDNSIDTFHQKDVSIGKGCLSGYCVGDRGAVESRSGKIIGVNPMEKRISLRFDNGAIGTFSIDDVSVSSLCYQYSRDDYRRDVETIEQFKETFTKDENNSKRFEALKEEIKSRPVAEKSKPNNTQTETVTEKVSETVTENLVIANEVPVTTSFKTTKDPNAAFCHLRSPKNKCDELSGVCEWVPATSGFCSKRPGVNDPNANFCQLRSPQAKCEELSGVCQWNPATSGYCRAR